MKKSMYDKEKQGFSLAEALITLLIVCLITLASIPILTKKRRNLDEGQRGMWICSRNSAGQYVYWDKNNPVGQKDNPDSWVTTNKCVFTPPAGADRFSITVIGGGGGGGNGESVHEVLARTDGGNSTSFSPSKTGMYDVIVIGGGGGGGAYQNTNNCSGGGGGGGGMFSGLIPLYQGSSYSLRSGRGGNPGGAEYHGGSSNSTSHGWAEAGSQSSFERTSGPDSKTKIIVNGGGGGEGVGCSKWKCRGGYGVGSGAGVASSSYYTSLTVDGKTQNASVGHYSGKSGSAGDYYQCKTTNIGGINKYKDSGGNETTYGDGGQGGNSCTGRNYSGIGGLVVVSKNWQHYGTGGSAAVPNSYYLPSITGQVEVEIAPRAQAELAGGNTVARIVRNGITGRTFIGYGAAGGKTNENLSEPGTGEHSQFTMKGGGTPAPACEPRKQIPAGWGDIITTKPKCTSIKCSLDLSEYTMDKNKEVINNNVTSTGVVEKPVGFENSTYYGMYVPNQLKNGPDDTSIQPYQYEPYDWNYVNSSTSYARQYFMEKLKIYYYVEKIIGPIHSFGPGLANSMKAQFPEYNDGDSDYAEFSAYTNKDDIYKKYRCYKDKNLYYRKECAEEDYVETKESGYHDQMVQPAICKEDGGNGTSFGAGGGGGNAGDSPGVFSRGGKGGYGAVVIEW